MSKNAVRRVSSISPSMKKEIEEAVASAIFTDLHIMKDEPDAMIGIITMEAIYGGVDAAIKEILIDRMVEDMMEVLFS